MKRMFVIITLFFIQTTGSANYGGWVEGNLGSGHLAGFSNKQVEIIDEDLKIDLYKAYAQVKVTYLFKNNGERIKVKGAFPGLLYSGEDIRYKGETKKTEIFDYKIEINGKKLLYKRVRGKKIKWLKINEDNLYNNNINYEWFVSEISFNEGEIKKVQISYNSKYFYEAGGTASCTEYTSEVFRYLLFTGANWKGPIKKGRVTINAISVDPDKIKIYPENRFKRIGKMFIWNFKNLEPVFKDNIIVSLNNKLKIYYQHDYTKNSSARYYNQFENKYFYLFNADKAVASSILNDKRISYYAKHAMDGNKKSAWVEGVAGDGIGESITLFLNRPQKIFYIGVIPGYANNRENYFKNNRIKKIKIIINDEYKKIESFIDEYTEYEIYHPKTYRMVDVSNYKKKIKNVKFIILEIYPGSAYKDTCISDIIFFKKLEKRPVFRGR